MGRHLKEVWYKKYPENFDDLKKQLLLLYPTLHINIRNGILYIEGSLYLINVDTGIEFDRYTIEIMIPNDYPDNLPIVRETDGRIPKILDRHFFPDTENACLFLPDEKYLYLDNDSNIIDFIKGPVESFFLAQSYYDLTHKWINGEWGHGLIGILEYYSELLNSKKIITIIHFLNLMSKEIVKGHWECYCGSGLILRNCHYKILIDMRSKIHYKRAFFLLTVIKKIIQNNKNYILQLGYYFVIIFLILLNPIIN